MEAINNAGVSDPKLMFVKRIVAAMVILLSVGGIGLANPDLSGEDSDHYQDLMLNHWSLVPQPFSSRFLHAEVVSLLVRKAAMSLQAAATTVSCVALILTVGGISVLYFKLKLDPLLLVFAVVGLAFVQTFQLIYMPDLFYTMLIVGLLLLLLSGQMLLGALMVFVLFCARESTIVLGVVLIGLSLEHAWSTRNRPQLKSEKIMVSVAFFMATIIGFAFNRYVTSKSAGNIHNVSGLVYLLGKAPFNFLKNVLGIEPWTNTLTATEGNHPIYKHAVPHGLHLGEIHEVGIAEMSLRYPLGWLTHSLCMFGVLLTVVCRHLVLNISPVKAENIGRFTLLRSVLLGLKKSVLEQPFYSRVALLYGLISFAIVPVLGTAVHRYIYYAWPAFWITGVMLLQRQYLDGAASLSLNNRVRLLIIHLLMAGVSILVTWYSAHWAPMLVFFIAAIILQCTAWFYLSKVSVQAGGLLQMITRLRLLALISVLFVAIGLRVWDFPARYEVRGFDELQYTQGSLELLEGMTPAYKYAPAGPQTWLGWGYAGVKSARYVIHPSAEERAVPFEVRPFVAVNHALFELYHDISGIRRFIVGISVLLSVLAVAAAFEVGARACGLPGGILLGGLFAVAPLMIDYAEQARSFSMAWSFVMISVYFAVCKIGKIALWGSAIFMGISIAQRIDMLVLMPLVWLGYWYTMREMQAVGIRSGVTLIKHVGITLVTTLLVAPWLMTNIIGNLRTIATVRFSVPPGGPIPWQIPLFEFSWTEGLAIVAVLFIAGSLWGIFRRKLRRPVLCIYVLLLLPSVLKSTGHEICHTAAGILALFIAAPFAIAALTRSPRATWTMVFLCLLLPLLMAMNDIYHQRKNYVPDSATAWVESHVPSGTSLTISPSFHDPLPTQKCADALWQEEMNNDAAVKKFQAGLARFHLGDLDIPRALSEENMIVERVERRGWYILGSRTSLPDRRYNIHLYGQSMVFGQTDPVPGFTKTGGVLIWRGGPLKGLADPIARWINADGIGTFIYCSADARALITP